MHTPIPAGDLKRQYAAIQQEVDAAVQRVLHSGWYILGPEVAAFEAEFAAFCGVSHGIGVASGTDALYLALAALDMRPGDEVVTVANACIYQTEAILQTGATPVLVDCDPTTHTMDPQCFEAAITPRTRAVLPVHLYGRMADMPAILAIAEPYELAVIEDAAQAHGAWMHDDQGRERRAGAWGVCGCFSFYPTKNLGATGDGGAVVTDDAVLAERLRRLRQYGWSERYVMADGGGRNSRLDELQAAVLRVKLRYLDGWNAARRERAAWYTERLKGATLFLPADAPGHVYHLYVVESEERDRLQDHLRAHGIGSAVHFPVPAHQQPSYLNAAVLPFRVGALPHTEAKALRVLSLPLYPELTLQEVERVAGVVGSFAH